MRIYFSGDSEVQGSPETLIPERKPHVMLSFYHRNSKATCQRLKAYRLQRRSGIQEENGISWDFASLFMDSGGFSFYNEYILRPLKQERTGRHGRKLAPPPFQKGEGDYSWFNLKKGSEFRKYCDDYAYWIKRMRAAGEKEMIFANVDVIFQPDLTWKVQRYFEEEHGLHPVPIVHAFTPMSFVDRYLESGRYDLLGVGGLGQKIGILRYQKWADELFTLLCPASKNYLPIIKTHGFAMTSHRLICRYPWWSVDSASWAMTGARGRVYIPLWSEKKNAWDFEARPIVFRFTWWPNSRVRIRIPPDSISGLFPQSIMRERICTWLAQFDLKPGEMPPIFESQLTDTSPQEEDATELIWSNPGRKMANLHYFKSLEESRPKWPHPFRQDISKKQKVLQGMKLIPESYWKTKEKPAKVPKKKSK